MMMYCNFGDIKINHKMWKYHNKKVMLLNLLYYHLTIIYILIVDLVYYIKFFIILFLNYNIYIFFFCVLNFINIGDEMGALSWCGEYKTWYNIL